MGGRKGGTGGRWARVSGMTRTWLCGRDVFLGPWTPWKVRNRADGDWVSTAEIGEVGEEGEEWGGEWSGVEQVEGGAEQVVAVRGTVWMGGRGRGRALWGIGGGGGSEGGSTDAGEMAGEMGEVRDTGDAAGEGRGNVE